MMMMMIAAWIENEIQGGTRFWNRCACGTQPRLGDFLKTISNAISDIYCQAESLGKTTIFKIVIIFKTILNLHFLKQRI